jgi:hypothetical protein
MLKINNTVFESSTQLIIYTNRRSINNLLFVRHKRQLAFSFSIEPGRILALRNQYYYGLLLLQRR